MGLRLYYCDHYDIPLPREHRFPMQKYALLRERLDAAGGFDLEKARLADHDEIELVHDLEYVSSFLKGMLEPADMRRIGFPWSEKLVRRTLASVGGTIEAAGDAVARGFGGNLAGGTHHAFRDNGSGFCVFNDIAVATRCMQSEHGIRRVAVLDLDVHQGDGTAAIFEDDPDVLTISVHGANNFPFRKRESKIDIALPDGAGDEEFLAALDSVLPRMLEVRPELVFFQSGVDGLDADALGRLSLTTAGLHERDRKVIECCRAASIPLTVTLGGGYGDPIEETVIAHFNTFLQARESFGG
jgi:acetoin utilization deacetylase AcuC-like enzyme